MISFDNLIAQHAELWPETNLNQQVEKYKEELEEFRKVFASKEDLQELADMVIVSAGMARFNYYIGLRHLYNTIGWLEISEKATDITDLDIPVRTIRTLWQAVELKMEKNRSRKWIKKDDVGYHHTEE